MTRHFATYSDSAYLPRLKALYASMQRHCGDFRLHVLAWDRGVADWCEAQGVDYEDRIDFTGWYQEYRQPSLPGPPRTEVEYMWTCGPRWIQHVMANNGRQPVTYVDADVWFHSSPEPVFAETGDAPAAVVPHGFCQEARWPIPTNRTHEVFGKYNVGLVHFRDPRVAEAWAFACLAWCYDKPTHVTLEGEGGILYADQKYLDAWPGMFGAHVIQHPGACAGPWAVHAQPLEVRDGVIHFGGRPLVSWHYSGYRELPEGHTVMTRPEYMLTDAQAEVLYRPYIRALEEAKR